MTKSFTGEIAACSTYEEVSSTTLIINIINLYFHNLTLIPHDTVNEPKVLHRFVTYGFIWTHIFQCAVQSEEKLQ